jgi:hypothetical protein
LKPKLPCAGLAIVAAFSAGLLIFWQYREPALAQQITMPEARCFLIVFGAGDKQPSAWGGSITATGAQILALEGWRFGPRDSTDGRATWKITTRYGPRSGGNQRPLMENGILVTAAITDASARFTVDTEQGAFTFTAADIGYATLKTFLNKRVLLEEVPLTRRLTTFEEEQDHPALAASGDDVWVSPM